MMDKQALTLSRELELERRLEIARARTNLLSFICLQMPTYEPSWHHVLLSHYLDLVVEGKIKRLIVTMPPRHGKSQQISMHLPAYILGRNPKEQIIAASYNATLAAKMNRAVQRIIDSPAYRDIFPNTTLSSSNIRTVASGNWLRNSDEFETVGYGGMYRSAGVGGSATGYGATLGIVDDPVRNRQDSMSPAYQQRTWEWWTSTFYSRLEKGGKLILVATRWSENDLIGQVLRHAKDNEDSDQWTVLNLPAIAEPERHADDPREEGEPLWPDKYDLKALARMRATMGERDWASLYQQHPSPAEGDIIKRSHWRFYRELPGELEAVAISADLNIKETKKSDFTVMQVWGRKGGQFYLIHQVRERMGWSAQKRALGQLVNRFPQVSAVYIEEAANGAALVAEARRELPFCVPIRPKGDKASRLMAVSAMVEAGNVLLPEPNKMEHRWVHGLIDEVTFFPAAANDDQVDALSQGLSAMRQRTYNFGRVTSLGGSKESLIGYEPNL